MERLLVSLQLSSAAEPPHATPEPCPDRLLDSVAGSLRADLEVTTLWLVVHCLFQRCGYAGGTMTKRKDVVVYHLEMRSHPHRSVSAPRDGLTILHVENPSVPYYRFLYNAVGKDYHWLSREKLSDAELATIIHDSQNELYVLHVDGSPAGFAELDRRQPEEIELVQFGLVGDFIGQRLGTWFLQRMIDNVWSSQPKRFWLHTCMLDHPAAIPLYKKSGFVEFKRDTTSELLT